MPKKIHNEQIVERHSTVRIRFIVQTIQHLVHSSVQLSLSSHLRSEKRQHLKLVHPKLFLWRILIIERYRWKSREYQTVADHYKPWGNNKPVQVNTIRSRLNRCRFVKTCYLLSENNRTLPFTGAAPTIPNSFGTLLWELGENGEQLGRYLKSGPYSDIYEICYFDKLRHSRIKTFVINLEKFHIVTVTSNFLKRETCFFFIWNILNAQVFRGSKQVA